MRTLIASLALVSSATAVPAQDIAPAWSPTMAGQAAALDAMNRRNAERLQGHAIDWKKAGRNAHVRSDSGRLGAAECARLHAVRTKLSAAEYRSYYNRCH